jgi:hypothetical protein
MLALAGLHRAVGNRLRLIEGSLHVEASTVRRSGSGICQQLLLNGIGSPRRRRRIRSGWGRGRLAASCETGECKDQPNRGIPHGVVIVTGTAGGRKCPNGAQP